MNDRNEVDFSCYIHCFLSLAAHWAVTLGVLEAVSNFVGKQPIRNFYHCKGRNSRLLSRQYIPSTSNGIRKTQLRRAFGLGTNPGILR